MNTKRLLCLAVTALSLAACGDKPATTAQAPAAAAAQTPLHYASFQEIMLTQIDANADLIWQSVAFINDENGPREHRPSTDEEWLKLRQAAILLVESPHLLTTDRPMKATRRDLPELDQTTDLDAVKTRILANRPGFDAMARTMQDVGVQIVGAIDRKDAEALLDLGGPLHQACEACHEVYYYPPEAAPAAASAPVVK